MAPRWTGKVVVSAIKAEPGEEPEQTPAPPANVDANAQAQAGRGPALKWPEILGPHSPSFYLRFEQ